MLNKIYIDIYIVIILKNILVILVVLKILGISRTYCKMYHKN